MSAVETPWPERVLVLRDDDSALDETYFSESELRKAAGFTLHKRRQEWLLSRLAAKQLAVARGLASDPRAITIDRPRLLVDGAATRWHVSLSHSAPYAAAAIDRTPIGLDIQVIRDLDPRAAHLFLTEAETVVAHDCGVPYSLLHFWCAKEALFKQRSPGVTTLKQVPIRLVRIHETGVVFDEAETAVIGDVIVAITR